MKTKDNAIHFRVSDDFVVILENCWRFLKRDYPQEYSKANDLKSFITLAILNELHSKPISKKIVTELDDGEIPELEFYNSKDIEGGVEDVLREIKAQVKKRKQK